MESKKGLSLEKQAEEIIKKYTSDMENQELIKELLSTEIGAETLCALWERWSNEATETEEKTNWKKASDSAKLAASGIRGKNSKLGRALKNSGKEVQRVLDESGDDIPEHVKDLMRSLVALSKI